MICRNIHRFATVRRFGLAALSATMRKSGISLMLAALCLCASGSLPAQTFTTLYKFGGGGNPDAGLVQGTDGNLYGTTHGYSGKENGRIFKITPSGTLTTLHVGGEFAAALIQGTDGNFYGTNLAGGTLGYGTVFKITPSGTLTTLYNFGPLPSGTYPSAALVQASDGNFYGTTSEGGTNSCLYGGTNFGCGTLFKITPSGTLTTLYNFCSQSGCADGEAPGGALVQGTDGNLYGTTRYAGNMGGGCSAIGGCGTVFKITTTGRLTTLHSFDLTDGANPDAGLIQATDGNFYGTTYSGGANNNCTYGTCGTVFKITPAGTLTRLHSFDNTDGANPIAGLIQATDGNFYGTTGGGGNGPCGAGCGTVFKITTTGTLTTLHIFDNTDGARPTALVQDTNGTLYGTTYSGGTNGYHYCGGTCGTIYSLSVGLSPFVEAQPGSGMVGAAVNILSTNLTGATSATFNGTAATFSEVPSSEITTNVPASATTGEVKVVTPRGMLSSNVSFQVP
jgi:uncharacterized repeat protein (TIGR03803 family)